MYLIGKGYNRNITKSDEIYDLYIFERISLKQQEKYYFPKTIS